MLSFIDCVVMLAVFQLLFLNLRGDFMRRHKLSRSASRRNFHRGMRSHRKNFTSSLMSQRGGVRA